MKYVFISRSKRRPFSASESAMDRMWSSVLWKPSVNSHPPDASPDSGHLEDLLQVKLNEQRYVLHLPLGPKLSPSFFQAKSRVSAELERPEPSYLFTTPRSIREQAQHCQFRPLSRCIGRFDARVGRSAPGKNRRRIRTLAEAKFETSKDIKEARAIPGPERARPATRQ